jgi:hypothetical protein
MSPDRSTLRTKATASISPEYSGWGSARVMIRVEPGGLGPRLYVIRKKDWTEADPYPPAFTAGTASIWAPTGGFLRLPHH